MYKMIIYCPKSRIELEVAPPVDSLDANAVVELYENGELTERAFAVLSSALNADPPEPYETVTGMMLSEYAEPSRFIESLIHESDKAYRIVNLHTLEVWIVALDSSAKHTLLYQD